MLNGKLSFSLKTVCQQTVLTPLNNVHSGHLGLLQNEMASKEYLREFCGFLQ